jgi:hypothetical protein
MSIILGIIIGAVTTAVIYEERDRRKAKTAMARKHRDLVLARQRQLLALAQQRQLKPAKDPNAIAWSPEVQSAERIKAIQERSNNA